MKKFLSVFLIVVLCLLTACNKNPDPSDKNVTPSPSTDISNVVTPSVESPSGKPTQQVTYPKASNKIVWQLTVVGGPAADNVDEVNRLLMEKGYDCEIEFVRAYPEPSKNREWLEQYESENQICDIINGGIWEAEKLLYLKQQQYALEMFTPLNDYLENTEGGRKLKDLFGETELSCKSFGDTVYVLPQLLSTTSPVTGSFLYVPNRYADLFTDYDGTYSSLKAIYEANHKPEEAIVVDSSGSLSWSLSGFVDCKSFFSCIPYDEKEHKLVDGAGSNEMKALAEEIWNDLDSGILVPNQPEEIPYDNIFVKLSGSHKVMEGYTEIVLKGPAVDNNFGLGYGISEHSTQKDLAFTILAVCHTDPDISALVFPEVGGVEGIRARAEHSSLVEIGELKGFAPELNDEQWKILYDYPFQELFGNILYYGVVEEITKEEVWRWQLNREYNADDICKRMKSSEYTEVIAEVNRQISEYLKAEEQE